MSLYGWNGFDPTTPGELWQERREELYARQDAERVLARFDMAGDPEPPSRCESGEAEEPDPVTAVDRWEWAQVAWCELDTSRLHMMTPEERERHTEPVKRYVDAKAFEKRFEKWVDGGCQFEKGSE